MKDFSLDLPADEFDNLLDGACDLIRRTHRSLETRKVFGSKPPGELRELFHEPLPDAPMPLTSILHAVEHDIFENATFNISPNFNAYVMSCSNEAGLIGEFLGAYLNQNNTKWHLSPSATEIEQVVIRWIKEFIHLPTDTSGILVSGGSVANLTCLTVARQMKARGNISGDGLFNLPPMILYASEQIHHCIIKSVETLGIGSNNVRSIPVNQDMRMNIAALEAAIFEDQASGLHPFCVVASAGTVNTGAIDPLTHIADICKKYDLWFHIDAAYGGPAAGTELVRNLFSGLDQADSIAMDPHKWFYVPIEAGCCLFKDPLVSRKTYSHIPEYLAADRENNASRVDLMEYGFQLSRNFKSLKIWMTFKAYGANRLRQAIENDIQKARYLVELIRADADFELLSEPVLSIVCFRYIGGPDKDPTTLDQLNNEIIEAIEKDGRIFITGTKIKGLTALRVCFVNHRTQKRHVEKILSIVKEIGEAIVNNNRINK